MGDISNLSKINISSSADEALTQSVERVNQGFEGGRVTKGDMASWLIVHGAGELSEDTLEEIRKAHFNQVTYLEGLLKKLKSTGRGNLGPEELSTLQIMVGQPSLQSGARKRSKPVKTGEQFSPDWNPSEK